jgi:hypothetical protein
MKTFSYTFLAMLCASGLTACEGFSDSVDPGYYGVGVGGSSAASTIKTSSKTSSSVGGSSGASQSSDDSPDNSGTAGGGKCDMTGRWLRTTHVITESMGQQQIVFEWMYYEIKQSGNTFKVTKGLLCGDLGWGLGLFPVTCDFSKAYNANTKHLRLDGRTGTSVPTSDGRCKVQFNRAVTVRGATVPYYLDISNPLPTLEQKATGGTPGWEDWDGDGNPGVTGNLSGTVTGQLYLTPRRWDMLGGTVPDVSSKITLREKWGNEAGLVSYNGSEMLASDSAVAADPTLHFVQLARLASNQATGDDLAICAAVRKLAPSLTPEASNQEH